MDNVKILDEQLATARMFALNLLEQASVSLDDKAHIPTSGGVYIFHERLQTDISEKIYVGIASNLRRRIHTDHLSAEIKDTMSALRRSLNKARGLAFGPIIQSWLKTNCTVSFIEIEDADMRKMVEATLICCLRSSSLLNKN